MANKNLKNISSRPGVTLTPQTEKADARQVKNNAGGYTFKVSNLDRAKRFLILGSDNSFYVSGAKLSKQNADNLIKVIEGGQSKELVDALVEVSTQGRAAKQDAGLFALAVASSYGTAEEKTYALSQLSKVARTGTTLFTFLTYVQQFRGWGRGLVRAVAAWYEDKSNEKIAFQAVKYRQRDGWTHADVMRKAHPSKKVDGSEDQEFKAIAQWVLNGAQGEALPKIIEGFEKAKVAEVKALPALIREYGLTWEMLPTQALNEKAVWDALLDGNVPLGALIRQLPRLTRIGIIGDLTKGNRTAEIVARLTDGETLKKARIHPVNLLTAMRTYENGGQPVRSWYSYSYSTRKPQETWTPNARIVSALEGAFYASFDFVEPTGKRMLIGLDVSGSMTSPVNDTSPVTSAEAVAAISMVFARTEPEVHIVGFDRVVRDLGIKASMSLPQVLSKTRSNTFGSTNAGAAIEYAIAHGLEVDVFLIMTDNETYAGRNGHVHELLQKYRKKTGIDAKLIVLATQATQFSIADPSDPGMLDIAGFDSAVPTLVSSFAKGL